MKNDIKRIMYLGNFGGKKQVETSQVKKTVSIYNYLINAGFNVHKINTEQLKSVFLPLFFLRTIYSFIKADVVIVSLNQNGLRFGNYFFLKYLTKFKADKKLLFITIGGWLPDFISKHPKTCNYFKQFQNIYVQAQKIQKLLANSGVNNTSVMWNFRDYNLKVLDKNTQKVLNSNYNNVNTIRLVFFAIIKKEKGLRIAIDAVKAVNKKYGAKVFDLDIIGPVTSDDYITEFNELIENNENICSYKGVLTEQDSIYETLSEYDCLVFPTYYEGEGFPTVIVEAFISGLPVIASDWKYNNEIIQHRINGLLFSLDKCDLVDQLDWLYINRNLLRDMKLNCLKEATKYHTEVILRDILKDIKRD